MKMTEVNEHVERAAKKDRVGTLTAQEAKALAIRYPMFGCDSRTLLSISRDVDPMRIVEWLIEPPGQDWPSTLEEAARLAFSYRLERTTIAIARGAYFAKRSDR